MKLTGRQKIGAGVVGVGLLALAIDRFALTPASAAAAENEPAAPTASPASPASSRESLAPPGGPGKKSLAERIAEVTASRPWNEARIPDAFRASPEWVNTSLMGPPAPPPEAAEGGGASENPLQGHRVTGIVRLQGGGFVAGIDRRTYRVGDMLDGFPITAIDESGIEFRGPSGPLRLNRAGPERLPAHRP